MFSLVNVIIERGMMSLNRPFLYAYFGSEKLVKGMRVKVEFAHSEVVGFLVEDPMVVDEEFDTYVQKLPYKVLPIKEVIDSEPIINQDLMDLAKEIADYYFSPLIEVYKAMLPPSLRPSSTFINKPSQAYIEKYTVINSDLTWIDLTSNQLKLYQKIQNKPLFKSEISAKASLEFLISKGLVALTKIEKYHDVKIETDESVIHQLNDEQEKAYDTIVNSPDSVYLIQGVTGSGKTEVYIKLLQNCLAKNQGSIVLVPEISLTDRLISKLKSIFKNQVALLHSGLTDAQKYDEYIRIARGEAKIVVGTRSAIFAPVANLSLIVIDEEHVESYKQDVKPFYDARKVALLRVKMSKAKLVYGSATPSLETKARADKGIYKLVKLENRFNSNPLPETEIVDLSNYDNIDYVSSIVSLPLRKAIQNCLDSHEQAIILLNRRGYSPIYICRKCQRIFKCPNCSTPLTFHRQENTIVCHHCDYVLKTEDLVCPHCGGKEFTYTGFGTERITDDLASMFPEAKIVRLDFDATKKKGEYHRILNDFNNGVYDIMVGTQMVAKGHDFPNVTLAVALLADQGLEFPTYKANEDTFDLLTQLSGRAGRKDKKGRAIIQTYYAKNEVIQLAKSQDYEAFYAYEMQNRKERKYPPYVYLMTISISSKDRQNAVEASYKLKNYLVSSIANKEKRADIFGPAIPYIEKLANRYYRKIMIKYKNRELIQEAIEKMLDLELGTKDIQLSIDVDPSSDL